MKKIALIGSTGSIGVQTLNIVRKFPEKFKIVALSAGNNEKLFNEQVKEFKPLVATLKKETKIKEPFTEYFFGENAFTNAIESNSDLVVIALVGFKGLIAVLDAIDKKKNIALANKESLVVGGELVTKKAKENNVKIYPIDSEHSAIWQALNFDFEAKFKKIIITASGGAFRDRTKEELKYVKAEDALKHPNWTMGAKITVDCATLVNKAFEVTEAKWLYNTSFEKISVIIHRQSIIHSMVEYCDGSIIAQLSVPNMELPISIALNFPERLNHVVESLNFEKIATLNFEALNHDKYPCFDLVLSCSKKGGVYPALANGANDKAVEMFLKNKIGFNDIYSAIDSAIQSYKEKFDGTIKSYIDANNFASAFVEQNFGE